VQQAGLSYPLLVRVSGYHAGVNLIRVDTPADMEKMLDLNRGDRSFYATEFCDFVSPDGLYRKFRMTVVGDEIFLRHMIVGEKWLLHAARRTTNTQAEELDALNDFDRVMAPRMKPVFHEIGSRLQLDFFGVDCAQLASGEVLLFEANACMNILENTARSPNMWDAPVARIKAALEALLARPRSWRHVGTRARAAEATA